jgi:hypothetical protein
MRKALIEPHWATKLRVRGPHYLLVETHSWAGTAGHFFQARKVTHTYQYVLWRINDSSWTHILLSFKRFRNFNWQFGHSDAQGAPLFRNQSFDLWSGTPDFFLLSFPSLLLSFIPLFLFVNRRPIYQKTAANCETRHAILSRMQRKEGIKEERKEGRKRRRLLCMPGPRVESLTA